MTRRILAPLLTLAACLVVWAVYGELGRLQGSVAWDLRYVILGCVAILVLTAAEHLTEGAADSDDTRP